MNEQRSAIFDQSIVINGGFSPADFRFDVFSSAGVLTREQILAGSSFSPSLVSVLTKDVNLNINENMVAISVRTGAEQIPLLDFILFVIKNSKGPIDLALNFGGYAFLDGTLENDSKIRFFKSDNLFQYKYFGTADSVYGFNATTFYKYTRFNLDVKPIQLVSNVTGEKRNALTVFANFQVDGKLPALAVSNMLKDDYPLFVNHFKNVLGDII